MVRSSGASDLEVPLVCDASSQLQFTFSMPAQAAPAGAAAVQLFANGPEGQVVWYWLRAGQPMPVEPGGRNVPLPGGFDVGALTGSCPWSARPSPLQALASLRSGSPTWRAASC